MVRKAIHWFKVNQDQHSELQVVTTTWRHFLHLITAHVRHALARVCAVFSVLKYFAIEHNIFEYLIFGHHFASENFLMPKCSRTMVYIYINILTLGNSHGITPIYHPPQAILFILLAIDITDAYTYVITYS